jgi:hypothetical protein
MATPKQGTLVTDGTKSGAQLTPAGGTSTSKYTPAPASLISGTKRTPTVETTTSQPDYTTTKFITNSVYQSLMGQDAPEADVQKFHKQFLEYAATHPIQQSTTNYDSTNTPVRNITAQKNPLSEADFISNIVRQGSDSKEYNAATTYFDAMRGAMGTFRGGY